MEEVGNLKAVQHTLKSYENEAHWASGCSATHPSHPYLYKCVKAFVHPCEDLTALCAVCSRGCYQLIPVIIGALQTNSWKPIKAPYYVITSPLSPETPL